MQIQVPESAFCEWLEFVRINHEGTMRELTEWVLSSSVPCGERERGVVTLASIAAAACFADEQSTFYRLELDEETRLPQRLAGRLVTSSLNNDEGTLSALVETWCSWAPADRADVLLELLTISVGG